LTGSVFTTLQKFAPGTRGDTNPVLTDRRNVVVIADEAHRSQYGFTEALDTAGRLVNAVSSRQLPSSASPRQHPPSNKHASRAHPPPRRRP